MSARLKSSVLSPNVARVLAGTAAGALRHYCQTVSQIWQGLKHPATVRSSCCDCTETCCSNFHCLYAHQGAPVNVRCSVIHAQAADAAPLCRAGSHVWRLAYRMYEDCTPSRDVPFRAASALTCKASLQVPMLSGTCNSQISVFPLLW